MMLLPAVGDYPVALGDSPKMNYVVIFTKTTAFYLENNTKKIRPHYKVLRNPGMLVQEVPPEYWKMGRSNIVIPMTDEERIERNAFIAKYGHDEDVFFPDKELGAPLSFPEEEARKVLLAQRTRLEKIKDYWASLDKEHLLYWGVILLLTAQAFRKP